MEDEKAIKILLKLHKASSVEKEYAKSAGLIHEIAVISHEKGMNWLEEIKPSCNRNVLINNFLFSLSTRRLNYRAGLAAFVVAQKMPWHDHTVDTHPGYCSICGDYNFNAQKRDFTFLNQIIFGFGGLFPGKYDPVTLAYYLNEAVRLPTQMPSKEDVKIFNQTISLILTLPKNITAPKLSILLGKESIFKSNSQERQTFLETLGYLSILENPEYPGYIDEYIPMNQQNSKHTRGDYAYPVDWWSAINGINQYALHYWFSPYIE